MEIAYKYIFTIENGVGKIQGRKQFEADCKQLNNAKMVMTLKRYKAKRSLSQNGYYWKVIIASVRQGLIDHGFESCYLDKDSVHALLASKFLKRDIANEAGEFITITLSTADLNKVEFGEYIDAIDRWAIDFLGFNLPLPEQQQNLNF